MTGFDRAAVIEFLTERGVATITLHHRTLMEHLVGTEQVLRAWGCADEVAVAGLCHAVYGTDGLVEPLVALDDRASLRELVGAEAEAAVYLYGCCDRRAVYPQLGHGTTVTWRDRFTERERKVEGDELTTFLLLTWANALEAASAGTDADWTAVRYLFTATGELVGEEARRSATEILGLDFDSTG